MNKNSSKDFLCKYCKKECKNLNSLRQHEIRCKENPNHIKVISNFKNYHEKVQRGEIKAWNKGLTKETDERIAKASQTRKDNIKSGKVKPPKGRHLSERAKQNIREGIAKAKKEGKHHYNIGEKRWKKEHSYPEKWLIRVLKNELNMIENIDYFTEEPFHKFRIDFFFKNLRKVIEIDGEQHYDINNTLYKNQHKLDIEKDELLKNENIKELRLRWSYVEQNKKFWIKQIVNFIIKDNYDIEPFKSNQDIYNEKVEKAKLEGRIDNKGHILGRKITKQEYEYRLDNINKLNIDFTVYGWKNKLRKLNIKLTIGQICNTLDYFHIPYYKLNNKNQGANNSNYGKHWYTSPDRTQEISCKEGEQPKGWIRGRKLNKRKQ